MRTTEEALRDKERAILKALPLAERFERVTEEDHSFLVDAMMGLSNGAVVAFCNYNFTAIKDVRLISEWVEAEAEEWGALRLADSTIIDVWTVDAHGRERLFEVTATRVVEADSEEVAP